MTRTARCELRRKEREAEQAAARTLALETEVERLKAELASLRGHRNDG